MKRILLFTFLLLTLSVKTQTCTLTASKNPACLGDTVWLKAQAGFSANNFTFSGPGVYTSTTLDSVSFVVMSLSYSGIYTCTLSNSTNTCVTSISFTVENIAGFSVAAGGSFCANSNAVISASAPIGSAYSWLGPGGFTSTMQNPLITNVQPTAAGIYTVIITSANGCSATKFATLIITPLPSITISATNTVCINNIISLTASGGVNYQWTGPNGFNSIIQSPTLVANSTSYSGYYQVNVSDANGCLGTASTNISVLPLPTIGITSGINSGCQPLCTNVSIIALPGISSVTLNLGNGSIVNNFSATTCYTNSGTYTINAAATDQFGCTGQNNYTVQVYQQPIADFGWSILPNGLVNFFDASYNASISNWNWYFGGTANQSNSQNPTFIFNDTTLNYNVCLVAKSDKGCSDTTCKTVFFNTAIGINEINNKDELKIYPNPVSDFLNIIGMQKHSEIEIYDGLGNLILKQNNTPEKIKVNVKGLNSGIHFVRIIQNNKEILTRKIVKD